MAYSAISMCSVRVNMYKFAVSHFLPSFFCARNECNGNERQKSVYVRENCKEKNLLLYFLLFVFMLIVFILIV